MVLKYRKNDNSKLIYILMLWVNYSIITLQTGLLIESYDGLYGSLNGTSIAANGMTLMLVFTLSLWFYDDVISERSGKQDYLKMNNITNGIAIIF